MDRDPNVNLSMNDIIKGFASNGSQVVKKAAGILEEELAAGIIAAKEVEKKFIKVSQVSSESNDQVMQRFRRDAHEIVDILMDVVNVGIKKAADFAQQMVTLESGGKTNNNTKIPTIENETPVAPGKAVSLEMKLENNDKEKMVEFQLIASDLISTSGGVISSSNIKFIPEIVKLGPGTNTSIEIKVATTKKLANGAYSGLIQAVNPGSLRAVIVVNVQNEQ